MKSMEQEKVTIEDLARMVQGGFEEMKGEFNEIKDRLNTIEKLILADHKMRIEKLEVGLKDLKDLLIVK
jgi:hypothetical protein